MRATNRERLREDLLRDHWLWSYTWRGLKLQYLVNTYKVPVKEILPIMREIAIKHDPLNADKLPSSRCKSCGMRIFWGKLKGEAHPYDPKLLTIGTVTGEMVSGRESHFVSCPNAQYHRKAKRGQHANQA